MASKCGSRLFTRTSTSFLKSAFNSKSSSSAAAASSPKSCTSTSSPLRRFSLSRSPSELGAVQSMMPLHSAVAAARMTSCLTTASRSCRALSQAGSFCSKVNVSATDSLRDFHLKRGKVL